MFWKKLKRPRKEMIQDAEKHLKHLGYELTPEGVGMAAVNQVSGYNAVETASNISVLTLARDVAEAGRNIDELAKLAARAMAMLEVLKAYKDKGLMREDLWKNDSSAIYGLAVHGSGENQQRWISAVLLNDEVKHLGRLAHFRSDDSQKDQ